jgi:2-dehydropantoate 2-reductase
LLIPQQPTTLGEIAGPPTPRVQEIAEVLRDAGFVVAISQNIDAWLKTHAVFVAAVCGALYCAGGGNHQLGRSTEPLALFADGVREGLLLLRTLGLPPAPLNLRVAFVSIPRCRRTSSGAWHISLLILPGIRKSTKPVSAHEQYKVQNH